MQKSIRERAGPPTFDCCIEMEDRQHWRLYDDVATACDGLLAGKEVLPTMRYRDAEGNAFSLPDAKPDSKPGKTSSTGKSTQSASSTDSSDSLLSSSASDSDSDSESNQVATPLQRLQAAAGNWKLQLPRKRRAGGKEAAQGQSWLGDLTSSTDAWQQQQQPEKPAEPVGPPMQVYVHGIEEEVLETVLKRSNLWHRIQLRDSLRGCDAAIGLRGKIKSGGWLRNAAKNFDVPIFSVKTSSPEHLTKAAQTILGLEPSSGGLFGGLFGNARGSDAQPLKSSQLPSTPSQTLPDSDEIPPTPSQSLLDSSQVPPTSSQTLSDSNQVPPNASQALSNPNQVQPNASQILSNPSQMPPNPSQILPDASKVPSNRNQIRPNPKLAWPSRNQPLLQPRPIRDPQIIKDAQPFSEVQLANDMQSLVDAQDSDEEEEDYEEEEIEEEDPEEIKGLEWYLNECKTIREPQKPISKAMSFGPKPLGYQAAMDEAIIAIEQVVIPRNQPIELLPRPAEILEMQMRIAHQYDMVCEVVGEDRKVRLRIMPA